jgi:hypothetical protein
MKARPDLVGTGLKHAKGQELLQHNGHRSLCGHDIRGNEYECNHLAHTRNDKRTTCPTELAGKARPSLGELPPEPPVVLTIVHQAFRADLFHHDSEKIRPVSRDGSGIVVWNAAGAKPISALPVVSILPTCRFDIAVQGKAFEVDYIPMVRVRWTVVHLFSAKIRENAFGIARIFLNQAVHLRNWRSWMGVEKGPAAGREAGGLLPTLPGGVSRFRSITKNHSETR